MSETNEDLRNESPLTEKERSDLESLIQSSEKATLLKSLAEKKQSPMYLIGGAVRDTLSGHGIPTDLDLYLECSEEEFQSFLQDYQKVREGKKSSEENSLIVDLARKENAILAISNFDFTVNALAYDLTRKVLIDPYNRGAEDARGRLLYPTSSLLFLSSPVAHLRLFRLSDQKELKVSQELIESLELLGDIIFLSDEVDRCGFLIEFLHLVQTENLTVVLERMVETKTLQKTLPELTALAVLPKAQREEIFSAIEVLHGSSELKANVRFAEKKTVQLSFRPEFERKEVLCYFSDLSLLRLGALFLIGLESLMSLEANKTELSLENSEPLLQNFLRRFQACSGLQKLLKRAIEPVLSAISTDKESHIPADLRAQVLALRELKGRFL